jgi:Uma2 family endonuclease
VGATLLTFEEFELPPDRIGKRELLNGELIELPLAEYLHTVIAHRIFLDLHAALDSAHARKEATGLGAAHIGMGYKLPSDSFVRPDVSVTHSGQAVQRYLEGAPAIAVEIISPSNTVEEMDLKTKLYYQSGAREVWRVHRKTRHVSVHQPGESHELGEDESIASPLLPGFALSVREILGE